MINEDFCVQKCKFSDEKVCKHTPKRVVQGAAATSLSLLQKVAFNFDAPKSIIYMVFMVHCNDNTMISFGKKKNNWFY